LTMGFIFWLTFGPLGSFCQKLTSDLVEIIIKWVRAGLAAGGASGWAVSLVCDGALRGVGGVLSFLPQIAILFLCLSVLEDSGYMARAAFIMDRPLRKIGLSGKSFVPVLMGFGCTVPAVLSTRILENQKDKRATIMITPFFSCNAKLPVYAMMIAAFFPPGSPKFLGFLPSGAMVIIFIYALGVALAALSALLANKTVLRGEAASFVMELPEYRLPTPRGLWIHVWERLRDYISKAGSVILGATIVVWLMINFTPGLNMTGDSSRSIMAAIGRLIAPLLAPAGFGDWKYASALLTGFIAKEQVYSTMMVIFGSEPALNAALRSELSSAAGMAFMVFVLLYTPCVAAVNAIIREMKSPKYSAMTIGWGLVCAWLVSVIIYQVFR
ncbi:MAG: ferrous iron transport protein B, partial [Oscillospiraceae bacterium]|nr:ferrous iron transport protein B [Oscillospiraceae bacterium]